MELFKKILVPTDLSVCATAALKQAIELSGPLQSSVDVLYVVSEPLYIGGEKVMDAQGNFVTVGELAKQRAHHELDAYLSKELGEGKKSVRALFEVGPPVELILKTIRVGGYGLVVMGTHGRSGLRHLLLGSVAEQVVRSASCPVMVLRG